MSKALKAAIEKNDPELVKQALKSVKDIDRKLPGAARPLEYACRIGADAVINVLFEAGATNRADGHPRGVLGVAAERKQFKVIPVLARSGKVTEEQIDWVMSECVLDARESAVEAILKAFKLKGKTQWIRVAEHRKSKNIVRMLIEHGADINGTEKLAGGDGLTPLHSAVGNADADYVKFLVECGADVHARDRIGRTPLMLLAHDMERLRMDNEEDDGLRTMEALVELGADAAATDNDGNDAIDHYRFELARSKEAAKPKVIKFLTKAGAKGSLPTFELFMALRDDDPKAVSKAIADGADVNRIAPPHWDVTPLMIAMSNKTPPQIVKLLIDAGADVNKPDRRGLPLVRAAGEGNLAAVKLLIEAGADVNALEPQRGDPDTEEPPENALVAAKENGHADVIEYLQSVGATKPSQRKWKPFEPGVASWNDFSEVLVNSAPGTVAKALAKLIKGKANTRVYGAPVKPGKRAYVVTQPKGMNWSNVFQVAPQRQRFGEEEKTVKFARELAAATNSQVLVIEYSDTSDAASIERIRPDGSSGREEGIDRDILQELVAAVGDEAPEWARQKLAETDEDEPSSTQNLEALAAREKFVVAAFGFWSDGREFDVEVRGYPAEAFEGIAWVSSE